MLGEQMNADEYEAWQRAHEQQEKAWKALKVALAKIGVLLPPESTRDDFPKGWVNALMNWGEAYGKESVALAPFI